MNARIKAGTSKCELCGTVAELRPYGPNGEFICFQCGMKNIEATEAAFGKIIGEGSEVVIDARTPADDGPSLIINTRDEP